MTNRILDFSERAARLRVRYGQLIVERPELPDASVPLVDLAVVIAAHPEVAFTQAVLCGLAEAGGAFVACNGKHMPVGLLLPLVQHHAQARRFIAQAKASLPLRKRLWQQIVRAKITAQGRTLESMHGTDHGLCALARLVRSGDPSNVEARAARRYWPLVFADSRFRRDPDNEDQNLLLNYGYAVLRAIVGRAICGAGLHPSLGLHHHHRNNAYCLADDLMEPFRPRVDMAVARYVAEHDAPFGLERAVKQHLVEAITARCDFAGRQATLFEVAAQLASSLAEVFLRTRNDLDLPDG